MRMCFIVPIWYRVSQSVVFVAVWAPSYRWPSAGRTRNGPENEVIPGETGGRPRAI